MLANILAIGFIVFLGILTWYFLVYLDYKKYIKKYPYAQKILYEFLFTNWKKKK